MNIFRIVCFGIFNYNDPETASQLIMDNELSQKGTDLKNIIQSVKLSDNTEAAC